MEVPRAKNTFWTSAVILVQHCSQHRSDCVINNLAQARGSLVILLRVVTVDDYMYVFEETYYYLFVYCQSHFEYGIHNGC